LGIVAFSLQEICHIWRHMGRSSIMLFDTRTNQRRVLIWESIFNRSRAWRYRTFDSESFTCGKRSSVIIYNRLANPDILIEAKEGIYLFERNIKFEFIPGITSAIAVPEYVDIPVTHRGIMASFRVVTGHESKNKDQTQIPRKTFKTDNTIVFFDGTASA